VTFFNSPVRFDSNRLLTEDELRQRAPSIFAVTAHESRSERFAPIPTIEILRGLAREGFLPVSAQQSTARDLGRRDFTKHMIRLRRMGEARYQVGDVIAEAILKNANDGSAAYDLLLGLFRIRCLNGMVAKFGDVDAVKVRHTGSPETVMGKVIEGTYRVIGNSERALAAPQDWARIQLDQAEAAAFAEAAHGLRFADADGQVSTPVQPRQLLIPRRQDDTGADLWTRFNVIQENAIRGGLSAIGRNATGQRRRHTTRAVTGIDQDVKLNQALWTLAARMAELKGAAAA
jgi:hypothetical protein